MIIRAYCVIATGYVYFEDENGTRSGMPMSMWDRVRLPLWLCG